MFFSETLARVIHDDRVRQLERAAAVRRLLATDDTVEAEPRSTIRRQLATPRRRPDARDGSRGVAV